MTDRMGLLLYDLQLRDWISVSLFVAALCVVAVWQLLDYSPFEPRLKRNMLNVYATCCLAAWLWWLFILTSIR